VASKELLKVVVIAVVVDRDDAGVVLGEVESQPRAYYGPDELAGFWGVVQAEVEMFNALANPRRQNGQQRRAGKGAAG
jgi:hypothetical protein